MSETLRLVSGIQHPGSAGGVYETTQHFNDIKEHLHVVKRDIDNLVQRTLVSPFPRVCWLSLSSLGKEEHIVYFILLPVFQLFG